MKKLKEYTTAELTNLIADVVNREVGAYKSIIVSMMNWWKDMEKKLQEEVDYPYNRRKCLLREVKNLRAEIDDFLEKEKK